MALTNKDIAKQRAARVRRRLKSVGAERPRLSVFRSSKNIYAQIIDDRAGVTLAAASSLEGGKGSAGSRRRTRRPRSASWSRNAPSKRVSRTSCSIAAATSITVGSRPSRTQPAKPV